MKAKAKWGVCASGLPEGEHSYQDYCWTCAPYWWNVPYCPDCGSKLKWSGFCHECRKYFDMNKAEGG